MKYSDAAVYISSLLFVYRNDLEKRETQTYTQLFSGF